MSDGPKPKSALSASADAIRVTRENVSAIIRGLPGKAKLALSAAVHLPKGSLTIQTPEGRVLHIDGNEPGPNAEVHLNNWNLPKRAFSGATIGVAESYLDGDWTSPDVTTFPGTVSGQSGYGRTSRWRDELAVHDFSPHPPLAQ